MRRRTVSTYPIPMQDTFVLMLPAGAEVLTFARERDWLTGQELVLWALVDPSAPLEPRSFRLASTGQPIDDDALRYIGTHMLDDGRRVLHLFEVLAGEPAAREA